MLRDAVLSRGWMGLAWGACAAGVGLLIGILPLAVTASVLLAAGIGILILVEPLVGVLLMLSMAPLKALIATEVSASAWLEPGMIGLALACFGWFGWRVSAYRHVSLPYSRIGVPVLVIGVAFSLSLVNAVSLRVWLAEMLKWGVILLLIVLTLDLGRTGRWTWIAFGVVLAGVLQSLIGVYEFLGRAGVPHLWILEYRYFRAFGTFGQPNPFSAFMGLTLPLALGLMWGYAREARTWWAGTLTSRWRLPAVIALFYLASSVLLLVGLVVSWGRGAWLAFGAAGTVMVFFAPSRRSHAVLIVLLMGTLVAVLWVAGVIPATIQARIDSARTEFTGFRDVRGVPVTDANYAIIERLAHWQAALNMASEHPLFGVGAGHYEIAYPAHSVPSWPRALGHAHNDYLNILAETGSVGLAGYLVAWGVLIRWTVRARHQANAVMRGLALGLLGAWTHLMVHSFVDKLYVNNLFLHIGVMLGLLALVDQHRQTWINNRDMTTETSHNTARNLTDMITHPFALWNQIIVVIAGRVGGRKAKEVERFLKFATVGVIGAMIDFGVLNVLQATVLRPEAPDVSLKVALATGLAFVSAVTSNFVWNRYWTYPDSRTRPIQRQWVQFFVVSLAGLLFRLVWVRTLYIPMGDIGLDALRLAGIADSLADPAVKRLGTNIAQFFAVWIVMVWNFFVNRYWTYNDVE